MEFHKISQEEQDLQSFYQMPKWVTQLNISIHAKYLYMLLLDRNRITSFVDDQGYLYQIFTRLECQQMLNVSKPTAIKVFKELVDAGLILDKRVGLTQSNRIYICSPKPRSQYSLPRSKESLLLGVNQIDPNNNNSKKKEEEEEEESKNEILNESFDDKKEEFDPQTFMIEFVKDKVKDEKQQNYLIELLSYKIIDLKTKTKSATATYILKAINQHGTEFREKTEVQPRKKNETAYKANKTRLETMPKWNNEPEQRTEEEEAIELNRIKELMRDLK